MAKEVAKTALEQRDHDYHAGHAARAMQILRDLNAAGKKLRPSDIRRSEEYAIEVLRHKKFAPWLLVYTAISGGFKEGWIPDNFYGAKVVPVIQGPYGRISFLKSLARPFFHSPSFPDLGSKINGKLFDNEYRRLSFDDARAMFFERNNRVVYKPDGTGRGKGVRFFDKRSFDRSTIEAIANGVFQRYITHHPFFDRYTRTSVAAVRITTVVEGSGEILPRAAYLCLGTGADTHVQGPTQVRVPLDVATGALNETGLLPNWLHCIAHPTSGEPFGAKKIPAFEDCIRTVVSHHRRISFIGSVGWDVTIDGDEEIHTLEWNGFHNGISFSEATAGPCFTGLGWERLA